MTDVGEHEANVVGSGGDRAGVTAVSGLSLDVDEGEFVVLVGPSSGRATGSWRLGASAGWGLEAPGRGWVAGGRSYGPFGQTNLIFEPCQSVRAVRSQDSMPAMWTTADDRARSVSLLMMA